MKEEFERHQAVGYSPDNGKTVIYTCPLCPGWERTFDLEKGTMKTENKDLYFYISHSGGWSLLPAELMSAKLESPKILNPPKYYTGTEN